MGVVFTKPRHDCRIRTIGMLLRHRRPGYELAFITLIERFHGC
jgi:hypothetical protein